MSDDKSILRGVTGTIKTLVDGTVRLQVDFEPVDRLAAMTLFSEPHVSIAVARIKEVDDGAEHW